VKELADQDEIIRRYAAFALGQTSGAGTTTALLSRLSIEKDALTRQELYEALGRIIYPNEVSQLAEDKDEALPWLYYRYGLRENTDSVIALRVSKFLSPNYGSSTRLGAAHFFARGKVGKQEFITDALVESALYDPVVDVRMAAAAGLKNMEPSTSIEAIKKVLQKEIDYRVRVNAIRSLAFFSFDDVKPLLFTALNDSSVNVGIAAAETIRQNINTVSVEEVRSIASRINNWRIQAILMEAVSVHDQSEVAREALKIYSGSHNDYQKAVLLPVIAQSIESFKFISQELLSSSTPVIQSAAAAALVAINRKDNFPDSLKQSFLETYKAAIENGDVAVIGIVTDALTDTTLGYKNIINDIDFLKMAKDKLSLPRDYESYVPLENAIAFFENRKPLPVEKPFNHPINWTLVKTINADQEAVIKTTKGDITIRLFVEEAPG
jgi:HEAT repeat protein